MKRHMRSHTGERPFPCHLCSNAFSDSTTLKRHVRAHTGERLYKCHLCPNTFTKNCNLKQHLLTHTGKRPFRCHLCPETFSRSYTLKRHVFTHTGERPFSCVHCGLSFLRKDQLLYHVSDHTGEKPCSVTSGSLEQDQLLVSVQGRLHLCQLCAYKTNDKTYMMEHLRTHTAMTVEVQDNTPNCKRRRPRAQTPPAVLLGLLSRSRTDGSRGEACGCCPHFRLHGRYPGSSPMFTSLQCLTDARTTGSLLPGSLEWYQAFVSVHGRLHSCRVCTYVSESREHMKTHLRTHTGERPFKCHLCPSTFTQRCNLIRHVRTHTGDRPFPCVYCSAAYSQKHELLYHMKSRHAMVWGL
nr:zinc finger protein 84-like [Dermacentor andersoni]